jgi:hypothetical protein
LLRSKVQPSRLSAERDVLDPYLTAIPCRIWFDGFWELALSSNMKEWHADVRPRSVKLRCAASWMFIRTVGKICAVVVSYGEMVLQPASTLAALPPV